MKTKTWDMDFRPDADRQKIFGDLVPGRECGDCSACCIHLQIDTPELKKTSGVVCENCAEPGCKIYETRFPVCRDFHCLWKHIEAMPDEARPDKLKIIFSLQHPKKPEHPFTKLFIGGWAYEGPEAYDTPLAQNLLAMFSQGDLPVWISTEGANSYLAHPDQDIVDVVMKRRKPEGKAEKKAAKEWEAGVRRKT